MSTPVVPARRLPLFIAVAVRTAGLILCANMSAHAVPVVNCSIVNSVGYVLKSTGYNTVNGNDMASCDFSDSASSATAAAGGGVQLSYTNQLGGYNILSVHQTASAVDASVTGLDTHVTLPSAAISLAESASVNAPANAQSSTVGYIQFGTLGAYQLEYPGTQDPTTLSITLNRDLGPGLNANVTCQAGVCSSSRLYRTNELVPFDVTSPFTFTITGATSETTSPSQSQAESLSSIDLSFRLFAADGVTPLPLSPLPSPEPATFGLLSLGAALGWAQWRRVQSNRAATER